MSTFTDEVSAYLSGFGDPAALLTSLRSADLVLPLDLHGQLFTVVEGGLPWMLAFTSVPGLRDFAVLTERNLDEVSCVQVVGDRLIDGVLDRAPEPTGLFVDPATTRAMTFPPTRDFTPHCYIDDEGEVVRW